MGLVAAPRTLTFDVALFRLLADQLFDVPCDGLGVCQCFCLRLALGADSSEPDGRVVSAG